MIKHIANIVTGCRILGSAVLLFLPAFSVEFYITYILCGFTDMIDGTVARKTNSASEFGAKFDTVADIFFMIVAWCKLGSAIYIPRWFWMWIIMIAILKFSNIIVGLFRRKTLISIHSILNKITGFVLFLLPLTIQIIEPKYSLMVICLIATFAAIQEGYYIGTGRVA